MDSTKNQWYYTPTTFTDRSALRSKRTIRLREASLLSGYIKKVRAEESAVFCAICGDILQDNIQNVCSKGRFEMLHTEYPGNG